jgi:hypothetical protein
VRGDDDVGSEVDQGASGVGADHDEPAGDNLMQDHLVDEPGRQGSGHDAAAHVATSLSLATARTAATASSIPVLTKVCRSLICGGG